MAGFWYALGKWLGGLRPKAPTAAPPPISVRPPAESTISAVPSVASPPVPDAAPLAVPAPITPQPRAPFHLRPGDSFAIPDDVSKEERELVEDFLRTRASLQRILSFGFKDDIPKEEMYANALEGRRLIEHFQSITDKHSGLTLEGKENLLALMERGEIWCQPLHTRRRSETALVALVDTETTGLEEHDEPISVAAVLLEVDRTKGDVLAEVDAYHGLREPRVPIHPRAQAVHGYTLDQLRGQSWDMKKLHKIVNSAELLVAHNAKFDRRMLAKSMPHVLERKWACSMYSLKYEWAKIADGKWALDTICASLSIARPAKHEAMADCRALQQVLMVRSGKTKRSKTLMGKLLDNPWAPSP